MALMKVMNRIFDKQQVRIDKMRARMDKRRKAHESKMAELQQKLNALENDHDYKTARRYLADDLKGSVRPSGTSGRAA